MIHRRSMLSGTVLGSALSALAVPAAAAGGEPAAQNSERQLEDVANAVRAVREELARQYTFWEIAAVRDQLRTFLKANGKFPDFLEVGVEIWQQIYDWHVRFQQPITLGRTAEGRYTILLLATNVVMRPDMATSYIGLGFDSR